MSYRTVFQQAHPFRCIGYVLASWLSHCIQYLVLLYVPGMYLVNVNTNIVGASCPVRCLSGTYRFRQFEPAWSSAPLLLAAPALMACWTNDTGGLSPHTAWMLAGDGSIKPGGFPALVDDSTYRRGDTRSAYKTRPDLNVSTSNAV